MIESEKTRFLGELTALSMAFPKAPDFTDKSIARMFWLVLGEIPLKDFLKGCKHALNTQQWFPPPATLKRFCIDIYDTDEDIGLDIANRIENAIGTYGYMNHKGAKGYIGERGWAVVEQLGGWVRVCDIQSFDQMPSLRANWRKLATLDSKRVNTKGENKPAALPKRNKTAIETAKMLIGGKVN